MMKIGNKYWWSVAPDPFSKGYWCIKQDGKVFLQGIKHLTMAVKLAKEYNRLLEEPESV